MAHPTSIKNAVTTLKFVAYLNFPLTNVYFYKSLKPFSAVKLLFAFVSKCVCNTKLIKIRNLRSLTRYVICRNRWRSVGIAKPDLIFWIENILRSINGMLMKLSPIVFWLIIKQMKCQPGQQLFIPYLWYNKKWF